MHPAWQEELVYDLMAIAKSKEFDVVLATHSPYIVGARSTLCVPLSHGPEMPLQKPSPSPSRRVLAASSHLRSRLRLIVFRAVHPSYVAVFVEGPDDVETWKPWLKWRPVPAGGCVAVLIAVAELRSIGEHGNVGIIDSDCERLEGRITQRRT